MGGAEAAGEVVNAGLIARAVEPHAGERGHGGAHGACLNCGTALVGAHCHACGQAAHVHRTFASIGHDLLHGVFHFEGKIWRTLPMLAFRPGELTRRYIAGERARFVSPIALFLFSVFLMFTVVANMPSWSPIKLQREQPDGTTKVGAIGPRVVEDRAEAQARLADATAGLQRATTAQERDPDAVAAATRRVAEARDELKDAVAAEKAWNALTLPEVKAAPGSPGGSWLKEKYNYAKKNPQLLLYKVKTSAYKFSWALIPISLPFIWLLFPLRRDVGMYDHAIFATYSLTFMSLLVVVLAVLGAAGLHEDIIALAVMLIVPFHIYRHLKGAYGLRRLGGLWRTFWMLFFALITSTLFVAMLLYLGVAD